VSRHAHAHARAWKAAGVSRVSAHASHPTSARQHPRRRFRPATVARADSRPLATMNKVLVPDPARFDDWMRPRCDAELFSVARLVPVGRNAGNAGSPAYRGCSRRLTCYRNARRTHSTDANAQACYPHAHVVDHQPHKHSRERPCRHTNSPGRPIMTGCTSKAEGPRELVENCRRVTVSWLLRPKGRPEQPAPTTRRFRVGSCVVAVALVSSPQRLGGVRWWMTCPNCGARCATMFSPRNLERPSFACRSCWDLAYASQLR
jgi:hypothetical protein